MLRRGSAGKRSIGIQCSPLFRDNPGVQARPLFQLESKNKWWLKQSDWAARNSRGAFVWEPLIFRRRYAHTQVMRITDSSFHNIQYVARDELAE